MSKIIGQNDGVENEKKIVTAFNDKELRVLSSYQKSFIKQMYENCDEKNIVHAQKIGGQGFKPDVEIEINGDKRFVSVKKGSGNSIHQEKIEMFLHYCVKELSMTQEEHDSLLMFLYGDGTIDGDSLPEERLKDQELINAFKNEIEIVQKFFDRNKRNLIERFLIYGRLGKERGVKADYLYHGDALEGIWCPLDYGAVDYLVEQPNSKDAPLSVGPLTVQVWNRNLEGKPEMESRRHSIQVKWGACKNHIKEINKRHLEKVKCRDEKQDAVVERKRLIGDNSQGFENQDNLISLIDGHRVSEMVPAVKNIVVSIYPRIAASEVVRARKIPWNDVKPRVRLHAKGKNYNLTIFMGAGNSVHQEKISNFLEYCAEELKMSEIEKNAFLTIMYGDGTLDGSSVANERLKNTEEVKKHYESQVKIAQNFFDKHKRKLIERFLIYGKCGRQKNIKVDYIYYGTDVTGRLVSCDTAIEYLLKKEGADSALLSLGSLTIQPWNRNPSAKKNLESRRHSLQIKWGGMKQDLSAICDSYDDNKGTAIGDWEEYELVSKLNREKKQTNKLWVSICSKLDLKNLDDIYAVRVSNMVYSKLSERMVLPKADVYLVCGELAHEVLLDNNYWLDEDVIDGLALSKIQNSGISCKRPSSKNFTYAKLTMKSFKALIGEEYLGAAISLFVTAKDIELNKGVLQAWSVDEQELIENFKDEIQISGIEYDSASVLDMEVCKIIKQVGIKKTKALIKENRAVREAIFYGKDLFEEPYTANFIYTGGDVMENYIPEFSITTGSGRHKGIYTIIIKP